MPYWCLLKLQSVSYAAVSFFVPEKTNQREACPPKNRKLPHTHTQKQRTPYEDTCFVVIKRRQREPPPFLEGPLRKATPTLGKEAQKPGVPRASGLPRLKAAKLAGLEVGQPRRESFGTWQSCCCGKGFGGSFAHDVGGLPPKHGC